MDADKDVDSAKEHATILPVPWGQPRALEGVTPGEQGMVRWSGDESDAAWERDPDRTVPPGVLFIPGSGVPLGNPRAPHSRRRWSTHLTVVALGCALMLALVVSVGPMNAAALTKTNPFSVLARAVTLNPPPATVRYRVQPGDTYGTIATRFGIAVGGIYQLNHLYMGSEAQVGQMLDLATDPTYGAHYTAPALVQAPSRPMGGGNSPGNCIFCALAGWSNGPGMVCAPNGTLASTDIAQYGLGEPENGAHWIRGFTSYHNGDDISTNVMGTPVMAAQTGVVIFAGWDPYGFGWSVKINHCGGLATAYGHLEQVLVSVGQAVTAGQVIGLQGASGMASGTHLHYMLWWDNAPVDPLCGYTSLAGMGGAEHASWCPTAQVIPTH